MCVTNGQQGITRVAAKFIQDYLGEAATEITLLVVLRLSISGEAKNRASNV